MVGVAKPFAPNGIANSETDGSDLLNIRSASYLHISKRTDSQTRHPKSIARLEAQVRVPRAARTPARTPRNGGVGGVNPSALRQSQMLSATFCPHAIPAAMDCGFSSVIAAIEAS